MTQKETPRPDHRPAERETDGPLVLTKREGTRRKTLASPKGLGEKAHYLLYCVSNDGHAPDWWESRAYRIIANYC